MMNKPEVGVFTCCWCILLAVGVFYLLLVYMCKSMCICEFRLGRSGTIQIDDGEVVRGESKGILQMLNVKGSVFIGKFLFIISKKLATFVLNLFS